jgi:hypothetical protein
VVFLVAIAVGLSFGAADQYLCSLFTLGTWTVPLSLLSAPWLVLPFVFGCSQQRAGRATLVGLAWRALCAHDAGTASLQIAQVAAQRVGSADHRDQPAHRRRWTSWAANVGTDGE